MNYMILIICAVVGLSSLACGSTQTRERWDWKPYDTKEDKQTKEGITFENIEVKSLPAVFTAQAQMCNNQGQLLKNPDGTNIMEPVSLLTRGNMLYQVRVVNETDHVIRLNRAIIRLFDPANNQWEPLPKDDLQAALQTSRPCDSTLGLLPRFSAVKLLDRNAEIVPGTNITGYLVFKPASTAVSGTWKLALYEVPVQTDEAGNVKKTARFEIRQVAKKYVDTYKLENMFSTPQLVNSVEQND